MGKALIATVGTGVGTGNIARPLAISVRNSHPDLVVFLVTKESRSKAEDVRQELKLAEGQCEMVQIGEMDNLNRVFQQVLGVIRSLAARGFSREEMEVDYTTGTKSMTAGLVLAAVAARCGVLKFVGGQRNGGIVVDETETVSSSAPGAALAYADLEMARSLFRQLRFDAASSVLAGLKPALLTEEDRRSAADLGHLIEGYDRWDKFDHCPAAGELGKVDFGKPENAPFRVAKAITGSRLPQIGKAIERGEISEDLLADLGNNAARRQVEGKYDDAVARLYRLVEMIAQYDLWQRFEIRASDVDVARAPETLRERLEARRDPKDGRVKIGLEEGYGLLAALKAQVGLAFQQNKRLRALLQQRNESILAHGTRPVSREACQSLFEEALALSEVAVPGFQKKRLELQFLWLTADD